MKKIIMSFFVVSLFALASPAAAQTGMMGNYGQSGANAPTAPQSPAINAALQEIYKAQSIDSQAKLDCAKVTDDQFEKLGDAYMGAMLSNQQQHDAMDNMMGGEGSANLRQAHINMGRSFSGCWANYNSGPIYMPMMGGYGSAGNYPANYNLPGGMMGWASMMGNYSGGSAWFDWITMILVWIFLLLGIAAAGKWLKSK